METKVSITVSEFLTSHLNTQPIASAGLIGVMGSSDFFNYLENDICSRDEYGDAIPRTNFQVGFEPGYLESLGHGDEVNNNSSIVITSALPREIMVRFAYDFRHHIKIDGVFMNTVLSKFIAFEEAQIDLECKETQDILLKIGIFSVEKIYCDFCEYMNC